MIPRSAIVLASAILAGAAALALAQDHAESRADAAASAPSPAPLGTIGRLLRAARPGDTVLVPEGVYAEHLRIDKPVALIAAGRVVIDGQGRGDIVEISAPDTTLRGFVIRNTGIDLDHENAAVRVLAPRATIEANTLDDVLFGIDLRDAPDCRIIGNTIGGKDLDIARRGDGLRLWRSDRALIERNRIHDGRDAILWYSAGVVVRDNTVSDSRYGLHLMFSNDVTIAGNDLARNSVGVYLMYSTGVTIERNRFLRNRGPSGYGVGLKDTDRFSIRENLFLANRSGLYIDGSPFTLRHPALIAANTFAANDAAITFLPSARGNQIVRNNFIDNIHQVTVAGRGSLDANRFWSGDHGNFWSDYTGYDQDADGIGDFIHEPLTLFEDLLQRQPALRLFLFSPAHHAVEFVARALPAVRPEPLFTDELPLMRPVPVLPPASPHPAPRHALLLSGVALASLGAVLIAAPLPRPRRLPRPAPRPPCPGVPA